MFIGKSTHRAILAREQRRLWPFAQQGARHAMRLVFDRAMKTGTHPARPTTLSALDFALKRPWRLDYSGWVVEEERDGVVKRLVQVR